MPSLALVYNLQICTFLLLLLSSMFSTSKKNKRTNKQTFDTDSEMRYARMKCATHFILFSLSKCPFFFFFLLTFSIVIYYLVLRSENGLFLEKVLWKTGCYIKNVGLKGDRGSFIVLGLDFDVYLTVYKGSVSVFCLLSFRILVVNLL